jgi:micrococcal nuclease
MGICYTKYKLHKLVKETKNYKYEKTKIFIPPLNNKNVFVCKVYDGDTFTIATKLPWNNEDIYRFSVRIKGIDCPELRTKDENEKKIALKSKEFLINELKKTNNIVKLDNIIYDKYGRLCADVFINDKLFKEKIINERLAVNYYGGTKIKPLDWKKYYENKEKII